MKWCWTWIWGICAHLELCQRFFARSCSPQSSLFGAVSLQERGHLPSPLCVQEVAWARPLHLNLGVIARNTSKFYKYRHRHNIAWCGDVNNHFSGESRQECHLWSCTLNLQTKQTSSFQLPLYAKELLFLQEFYSHINQAFLWCTCVA